MGLSADEELMTILRRSRLTIAVIAVIALPAGASASVLTDPGAASKKGPSSTCPLTGKRTKPSIARRPAVAVKVDNSAEARPQSGLGNADLVFESLVEGGATRFSAVFHCGSAASVGPVRSTRYDDGEIVEAYANLIATSGSNASVADHLNLWGVPTVDEGSSSLERDDDLDAPYNLFADTEDLRALAEGGAPAGMTFGSIPPGSKKVSMVELRFSDATQVGYRWTRRGWARSQDGKAFTSGGSRIYVENVLVQIVDVVESETLVDQNGVSSPLMSLAGKGKAYLFRNGRVIAGKWNDDGEGPAGFRTVKGKRFTFSAGTTWYELVPSGAGELTGMIDYR